jgi:outer membrane protein TolC
MKIPENILRLPGIVLLLLVLQPAFGGSLLGADLAGLLNYAREHNPELAAMHHEADAARQRVDPAGALPDPVLRTELMDVTNQGKNRGASLWPSEVGSTRYLLMQSVPWFGKRDLQREVAGAEAAQADGQVASTWVALSGRIKSTYARYYYLAGSERLTRESLVLLDQLERIAQARYANGLGEQQDVLRAQVAQTTLRTELLELESERHHEQSRLNALLSRPAMAELAEPAQLRPLPVPAQLDYVALEQKLRARNPQLQVAGVQVQSAEKGRDLAYARRYPDLTLGVAPNQSGNAVKSWDLMVEFNIPLQQGSRRAQEQAADALIAASESRKQALLDRMLSELSENLYGLETARRTESLTATRLLPQSELTYRSALAGYETGRVEFAMLIEAQRQILQVKQQRLKAQRDAQLRLAEIEGLLGEDL